MRIVGKPMELTIEKLRRLSERLAKEQSQANRGSDEPESNEDNSNMNDRKNQ